MKICKKCGISKSINMFGIDSSTKDKLSSHCKICKSESNRQTNLRRKESSGWLLTSKEKDIQLLKVKQHNNKLKEKWDKIRVGNTLRQYKVIFISKHIVTLQHLKHSHKKLSYSINDFLSKGDKICTQ